MSKNHPHDNIYSILGKLEALKPTSQEKHDATVQQIRESVEAQGSIIEGVSSVETRLLKEFAETKSVPDLPIDKKGIEKYYGGSVVKMGQAAKAAGFSDSRIKQTGEKFLQGKLKETDVEEKAPPGEKAERMVKGIKKSLSKDGHLSDKDKAIAYATTWKAHNKGQVEEAYNPVKAVKQCAKDYMEMNGIASVHDLEAEDIESIGGDCQMNYQDVCEILGCNLPDSLGPVKSWDTDKHGNKFDLEESTCNECGLHESKCSCKPTNEGTSKFTPQDIQAAIDYKNPAGHIYKIANGKIRFNLMNMDRMALDKLLSRPLESQQDWDMLKKQMKQALANQLGEDNMNEGIGDSIKMAWAKTISWVLDKAISMSKDPVYKKRAKELLAQETAKAEQIMLSKIAGHPREEQLKQQVHYIVTQLNQQTTMSGFINTAQTLFTQLQAEREKFSEDKETTHTGGEKVPTKFGTLHKSKATVDTERDVMTDKQSDPDKDDEESDTKEKKGRGRPKKAEKDTSQAKMPWGGKPPKDTYKHQKGSFVHTVKDTSRNPEADAAFARDEKIAKAKGRKISEAMNLVGRRLFEGLNLRRMMEEQHMTLDEMIECMNTDMKMFKETGVCSDRLRDMMEVFTHAKKQVADEGTEQGIGHDLVSPQERLAPHAPAPQGVVGKTVDTAKRFGQWLGGKEEGPGAETLEEVDPLEEELAKLAELAGLGEISRGKYIKQKDAEAEKSGKDKFQAFGQEFDTDEVDEELEQEGTLFTKGLHDDDVKIGDKIPGTNAIKKVDIDEDKIDVDDTDKSESEYANKPNPKFGTVKNIVDSGDDLNRKKKQDPHTANRAANPLTNMPTLEAKLMAEYESIKKVSK